MSIYKDDAKERPTVEVAAIGQLGFEGNTIPHTWRDHLRREDKRADKGTVVDLEATVVLAEIVYWYRPTQIIDEKTSTVLGWKKKFWGDKLQLSYDNIAEKTGLTKLQVKEAMDRLVSRGLVSREFRHIGNASNVLYIGIDVDRIKAISFPKVVVAATIPGNYGGSSPVTTGDDPPYLPDTYTETTTKTTTESPEKRLSTAPSSGGRGRSVPKTGYREEPERVAVGDENGNERNDARAQNGLERYILRQCQGNPQYLSPTNRRKLQETIYVYKGKAQIEEPSPLLEWEKDSEGFEEWVGTVANYVGGKGNRPTLAKLIQAIRNNYDAEGWGWLSTRSNDLPVDDPSQPWNQ